MPAHPHHDDDRERRCPMLGHPVRLSYCRTLEGDSLCRKILDCWWEEFDVAAWVRDSFGEEAVERLQAPRKPRVLSLLEIIEKARRGSVDK